MNDAYPVSDESAESLAFPFRPSPQLHDQLGRGVVAVLAAGSLAVASALVELSQDAAPGVTLAHVLGWAALVPLFVVLRTYRALARETESFSLARSSQCVFGMMVVANVCGLALLDVLPMGWQIAAWVVVWVGLLALVAAPFVSEEEETKVPAETPAAEEKEETTSGTSKAGIIGGAAAGLLILLKLVFKGGLAKFVLFRWAARLLRKVNLGLEAVALLVLLPLGAAFLIWFGVTKIRLRDKLGSRAVLLGWMEIVMTILFAGLLTWFVIALFAAVEQPGMTDKELEALVEEASRTMLLIGVAVDLLWTALTVFLFVGVRNRFANEEF